MGKKVRINITVDRETLRLADREAHRRKTSRSEFIRLAVRAAATDHDRESDEEASRERQRRAIEGIRRIAHKLGDWPAVEVLHEWRYRL